MFRQLNEKLESINSHGIFFNQDGEPLIYIDQENQSKNKILISDSNFNEYFEDQNLKQDLADFLLEVDFIMKNINPFTSKEIKKIDIIEAISNKTLFLKGSGEFFISNKPLKYNDPELEEKINLVLQATDPAKKGISASPSLTSLILANTNFNLLKFLGSLLFDSSAATSQDLTSKISLINRDQNLENFRLRGEISHIKKNGRETKEQKFAIQNLNNSFKTNKELQACIDKTLSILSTDTLLPDLNQIMTTTSLKIIDSITSSSFRFFRQASGVKIIDATNIKKIVLENLRGIAIEENAKDKLTFYLEDGTAATSYIYDPRDITISTLKSRLTDLNQDIDIIDAKNGLVIDKILKCSNITPEQCLLIGTTQSPTSTQTASETITNTNIQTPITTKTFSPTSANTPTFSKTTTSLVTKAVTISPTVSSTASSSQTKTGFITDSKTPTDTATYKPTQTLTTTLTNSETGSLTKDRTDSQTLSETTSETHSLTKTPRATDISTKTFSPTSANTPTFSKTTTSLVTKAVTISPTVSSTASSSQTKTGFITDSKTPTDTATYKPTQTLTTTLTNSETGSLTKDRTDSQTLSETTSETHSLTKTPRATDISTKTFSPTSANTPTFSKTTTSLVTKAVTISPTVSSTASSSQTKTGFITDSKTPTDTATYKPTQTLTTTLTNSETGSLTKDRTDSQTLSETTSETHSLTKTPRATDISTKTFSPTSANTPTFSKTTTSLVTKAVTISPTVSSTASSSQTKTGFITDSKTPTDTATYKPTQTLTTTLTNSETGSLTKDRTDSQTLSETDTSSSTNSKSPSLISKKSSTQTNTQTASQTTTSTSSEYYIEPEITKTEDTITATSTLTYSSSIGSQNNKNTKITTSLTKHGDFFSATLTSDGKKISLSKTQERAFTRIATGVLTRTGIIDPGGNTGDEEEDTRGTKTTTPTMTLTFTGSNSASLRYNANSLTLIYRNTKTPTLTITNTNNGETDQIPITDQNNSDWWIIALGISSFIACCCITPLAVGLWYKNARKNKITSTEDRSLVNYHQEPDGNTKTLAQLTLGDFLNSSENLCPSQQVKTTNINPRDNLAGDYNNPQNSLCPEKQIAEIVLEEANGALKQTALPLKSPDEKSRRNSHVAFEMPKSKSLTISFSEHPNSGQEQDSVKTSRYFSSTNLSAQLIIPKPTTAKSSRRDSNFTSKSLTISFSEHPNSGQEQDSVKTSRDFSSTNLSAQLIIPKPTTAKSSMRDSNFTSKSLTISFSEHPHSKQEQDSGSQKIFRSRQIESRSSPVLMDQNTENDYSTSSSNSDLCSEPKTISQTEPTNTKTKIVLDKQTSSLSLNPQESTPSESSDSKTTTIQEQPKRNPMIISKGRLSLPFLETNPNQPLDVLNQTISSNLASEKTLEIEEKISDQSNEVRKGQIREEEGDEILEALQDLFFGNNQKSDSSYSVYQTSGSEIGNSAIPDEDLQSNQSSNKDPDISEAILPSMMPNVGSIKRASSYQSDSSKSI